MVSGSKRRECWAARDAFFACLDQGDGQMSPEAEKRCSEEWQQFQAKDRKSEGGDGDSTGPGDGALSARWQSGCYV
ncbi:unnamed protein product [Durusdinium trenchii]|uniref:Uncharacterized protein n=1 Tax=Durusdinium trenchii TaxID=1381693 RepID=A0ABP0MTR7_9DINO